MRNSSDWLINRGLPIVCLIIIVILLPGAMFFWKTHPDAVKQVATTEEAAMPPQIDPALQLPYNSVPPPLPSGTNSVDFTSKDLDGKSFTFHSHSPNIKILEFWATWCGPCHMTLPEMQDLNNVYKSSGVQVIGVAVDDATTFKQVKPLVDELGLNYQILVDPAENQNTSLTYNATGLPSIYIIDGKGIVRWSFSGYWPDEEPYIRQIVDNLQAGKPAGLP